MSYQSMKGLRYANQTSHTVTSRYIPDNSPKDTYKNLSTGIIIKIYNTPQIYNNKMNWPK